MVRSKSGGNAPVEVGSFSYYLQGFIHPKVVVWDFRTINNLALYQGVMRSEAI